MWKRRFNPHNYPTIFKLLNFFTSQTVVSSLTIITILLMLWIIYVRVNLINPNIVSFCEIKDLQVQLLSASSIIVSLMIAFVISKYFDIQNFRKTELSKFIKLQKNLTQYLKVFYHLGDQLERKYHLKPKYPLDHKGALKDQEYSNNPSNRGEKPDACIFTSALREAGYYAANFDEYEVNRRIIPKNNLKKIEECLSFLSGVLSRQKYYKYLLEDLEIDESYRHSSFFSDIKIAEGTLFVKEFSMDISPKNERKNWETLEYWNNRIDDAYSIVLKMLILTNYLHDYKAILIRKLLRPLLLISIFGIILPLLMLSIQFTEDFEYYITFISLIGFLLFFIYSIALVYSELTSDNIQRL